MVDNREPRPPRSAPPPPRKKKKSYFWLWLILGLIVLGLAVAGVTVKRMAAQKQLQSVTQQMAVQTVLTVNPTKGAPTVLITLPGSVQAYIQTTVYAQVTGYLKRWLVDIGTPVKEGQLLAEIETPQLDQQLAAAQATVVQGQASTDLAQTTADRYNSLADSNAVSKQDVDTNNGNLAVAKANLTNAKANVAGHQ